VAALLGGTRVPVSECGRGHSPDIQHDHLRIEVKSRRKLLTWLEDAMKQARACAQDGRLTLIVLHQDGQLYQDALMVMRLKDLFTSGEEK
jgi:hypothetical protein